MRRMVMLIGVAGCGFRPAEGTWLMGDAQEISDPCEIFRSSTLPSEPFGLFHGGTDLGFAFLDETVWECKLEADEFACDPVEARVAASDGHELVTTTTATGAFSDPEQLTVEESLSTDCEGPDCASVALDLGATFPCPIRLQRPASFDHE